MIYKIVQGNAFKLHILVRKMDMSKEFNRLVDFDMTQASDIKVELQCCFDDSIIVPTSIGGIEHNVLVCNIPSTLDIGNYNVAVSWNYDGYAMKSVERNILQIIETNHRVKVPCGVFQGETVGMFDLRYYMVTKNQSDCTFVYSLDDVTLSSTPATLKLGEKYETTLTPAEGFNLGLVKVVMDGADITRDVYKDGKIEIPAVSGYVSIMANGDDNIYYYGATAAKDMCQFNMEDLTKVVGDIVDKSINITTTKEKPYIWFASRVPVEFYQSGLTASLYSTKVGDIYYYWTDELKAGEYIYNAKLK